MFNREEYMERIKTYLKEENTVSSVCNFSNTLAGLQNGWFIILLKPGLIAMHDELQQRHAERLKDLENRRILEEADEEEDENKPLSTWKEMVEKFTPEIIIKPRKIEDEWKKYKNQYYNNEKQLEGDIALPKPEAIEELSDIGNDDISDMENFWISGSDESGDYVDKEFTYFN